MGSSRFSPDDWSTYSTATKSKPRAAIFKSEHMKDALDPKSIKVRESVDSAINPNSTPIILASDVTGSMGSLSEHIIKHGMGVIMGEIYDRKPVSDPHLMVMAIGDANYDKAPLQCTQFEADICLAKQMEDVYLEGGGGGNHGESYNLPLYFVAFKTKCDAITKRKRKGYLFTIGDEPPLMNLTKEQIKTVFGDDVQHDFTTQELLDIVTPNWEVFHLIVKPIDNATSLWKKLRGQHALSVDDPDKLAEVIVSTIQVIEGADHDVVAKSWDGSTSVVVANATRGLTKGSGPSAGVARL